MLFIRYGTQVALLRRVYCNRCITYKGSLRFQRGPLNGLQLTLHEDEVDEEADELSPIRCLVEDPPPLDEDILGDLCFGEADVEDVTGDL